MNIRLKAGLEVLGFVVSAVAVAVLANLTLEYLKNLYGSEQVVQGIYTFIAIGGMVFLLKLMYDIRVAQLGYRNKLDEMTKK
jgi:hypothetical protein